MSATYASSVIETNCHATMIIGACPENDERPKELREALVGIKREDGKAMVLRLSVETVDEICLALRKSVE